MILSCYRGNLIRPSKRIVMSTFFDNYQGNYDPQIEKFSEVDSHHFKNLIRRQSDCSKGLVPRDEEVSRKTGKDLSVLTLLYCFFRLPTLASKKGFIS